MLAAAADRGQAEHPRRARRAGRWCRRRPAPGHRSRRPPRRRRGTAPPIRPSPPSVKPISAAIGSAPLPARSLRLTVTSFQPTEAGGSLGRKCTPSAIMSWVRTRSPITAASSSSPRAAGWVASSAQPLDEGEFAETHCSLIDPSAIAKEASVQRSRPRDLGDGVEQAVDEALLALVVEGVGDVDIFADHAGDGDVGRGRSAHRRRRAGSPSSACRAGRGSSLRPAARRSARRSRRGGPARPTPGRRRS